MPYWGYLVFAGLGWIAPVAAHLANSECWIYLPAHAPALLGGLVLGPLGGVLTALSTVAGELSVRGPRGRALAVISAEITAYGLLAGLLGQGAASWLGLLGALAGAMVGGRTLYLALARGQRLQEELRALFVLPWPGILIQAVILPAVAHWIR